MSSGQHTEQQGGLTDAQLMAYLEGRLTGEELHALEARLAEEGMESDALEGLQDFGATAARDATRKLNRQLRQSLGKKKRMGRRGLMDQRWGWMALTIVLLLAVISFTVIWIIRH